MFRWWLLSFRLYPSYDFGKPKWYLLEVLKVPSVYRGLRLVYFYDDGREFDVSLELQIEYYD